MRRLLCLSLVLFACGQPTRQPPKKEKATTSQPQKQKARTLALQAPTGDTKIDKELRDLQKKIAALPKKADLWELLARAWVHKARESQNPELYANAKEAADEALALDPKRVGPLEIKGLVLQNEHRFFELLGLAKEMLEKDPKNTESWALLGDAALELGDYDKAIEAYQEMLDLRPGLSAYARVAYLRWLLGDVEGALEMWQEAIAVGFNKNEEQLAFCFAEEGVVRWLSGDLEKAESRFQQALALLPDYAPARVGRGKIRFAKGDLSGAQSDFAAAVKAHPTVEAYRWLSAIARQNKDEATAKDAEAKLELEGRRGDFRTLSLFYSMANKDANTALALAKKDAEQRGGVYTHDALAFALFRQGKREEAQKEMELALSENTQDPMLFAHAGLLYNSLGDTTKAKELLDKAWTLNPFFDPVLAEEVKAAREKLSSQP